MTNLEKIDTFKNYTRYTFKDKDQFNHKFVILVPVNYTQGEVIVCPNFCLNWCLTHKEDVNRINDDHFRHMMDELIEWEVDSYNEYPYGTYSGMRVEESKIGYDVHGIPIYRTKESEGVETAVAHLYNFVKLIDEKYYYAYHSLESEYNWYYKYYES